MQVSARGTSVQSRTFYGVLIGIGCGHFFNDSIQAVIPAMNPILEKSLSLNDGQWAGSLLLRI